MKRVLCLFFLAIWSTQCMQVKTKTVFSTIPVIPRELKERDSLIIFDTKNNNKQDVISPDKSRKAVLLPDNSGIEIRPNNTRPIQGLKLTYKNGSIAAPMDITFIEWSPKATKLVACITYSKSLAHNNKHSFFIWDTKRGNLLSQCDCTYDQLHAISWSPDETKFAFLLHQIR